MLKLARSPHWSTNTAAERKAELGPRRQPFPQAPAKAATGELLLIAVHQAKSVRIHDDQPLEALRVRERERPRDQTAR
jgi:hypothetical protein